MDRRIIELYDEYAHAPLPRRVFLDRLAVLAGGSAAAALLLPLLEIDRAAAATVAPDDARIVAARVRRCGIRFGYSAFLIDCLSASCPTASRG